MAWSIFNLFGGAKPAEAPADPVLYKGYSICPAPRQEAGHWLTAGIITKTFDDEAEGGGRTREHHFIRAETHGGKSDAEDFAVIKGKQIIDEFGDRMFKS